MVKVVSDRGRFSPRKWGEPDSGIDDSGLVDSVSRPWICPRRSRSRWTLS